MTALRILLLEGSSLSAREATLTLGRVGHVIDVLDPDPFCLCRFSKFVRRVYRSPRLSDDPVLFSQFLLDHLSNHSYDLLLPVHEHAFLLSAIADKLNKLCPTLVAPFEAFQQIQDKVQFFGLLTRLGVPYPPTQVVSSLAQFPHTKPVPFYVKTALGTAGDGTWLISTDRQRSAVIDSLRAHELEGNLGPFIVQDVVPGTLEVIQSIFQDGKLISSHVYRQQIEGVGGSASGRMSVQRPAVVAALRRVGESLAWSGPLMLDYILDTTGQFWFIDPNPRIGETMNAFISGNNIPQTLVDLTIGNSLLPIWSREGIRSHIFLTALLATAIKRPRRLYVLSELLLSFLRFGKYRGSHEEITSIWNDPLSVVPLAFVAMRLLIHPSSAKDIAQRSIRNYALSEHAANSIRAMRHAEAIEDN